MTVEEVKEEAKEEAKDEAKEEGAGGLRRETWHVESAQTEKHQNLVLS